MPEAALSVCNTKSRRLSKLNWKPCEMQFRHCARAPFTYTHAPLLIFERPRRIMATRKAPFTNTHRTRRRRVYVCAVERECRTPLVSVCVVYIECTPTLLGFPLGWVSTSSRWEICRCKQEAPKRRRHHRAFPLHWNSRPSPALRPSWTFLVCSLWQNSSVCAPLALVLFDEISRTFGSLKETPLGTLKKLGGDKVGIMISFNYQMWIRLIN